MLGPLLFLLYTAELAELVSRYGVMLHSFADDNQLYIHCRIDDVHLSVADLEHCVTAIGHWMSANRLNLNTDSLIWTGTRINLERIPGGDVSLTLGNVVIPAAESVRVLGVVITPDLWLDKHVTAVSAKFFPATAASSSSSLARLRLSSDIGARLRHQSG